MATTARINRLWSCLLHCFILVFPAAACTETTNSASILHGIVDNAEDTTITNTESGIITVSGTSGISSTASHINVNNFGTIVTFGGSGIVLEGAANGAVITNTGSITTSEQIAQGIYTSPNSANIVIVNSGSITTAGNLSYAIFSVGDYNSVLNSGSIVTSGPLAIGMYALDDHVSLTNTGTISTEHHGLSGVGDYATLSNTGSITTSGSGAVGLHVGMDQGAGNFAALSNSGLIMTTGFRGYGMLAQGDSGSMINTGSITTSGIRGYGMYGLGDSGTLSNTGSITTSDQFSHGMILVGTSNSGFNSGSISTSGQFGSGVFLFGNNSSFTNTGSIVASASSAALGVYITANNASFVNSGSIRSTTVGDPNSAAIYIDGDADLGHNNSITLKKGSVIVGDIFTVNSDNKLYLNLGAGTSYAYTATGDWIVQDLDHRPVVVGSAYAAGIGAQESAAQVLFERSTAVTDSLARASQNGLHKTWADTYYQHTTRDAGELYSLRTQLSRFSSGAILGFDLPSAHIPLQAILNYEHASLNIDEGSQTIKTSSVLAGVLAPQLAQRWNTLFSGHFLLGYSLHHGDRKVLTNVIEYNGSRQITAKYHSLDGLAGVRALKKQHFTSKLEGQLLLGLNLASQQVSSYSESDYYTWEARHLFELQSQLMETLTLSPSSRFKLSLGVGVEHFDLMLKKEQNYSMNGTSTVFHGVKKSDTYWSGQVGAQYEVYPQMRLFTAVKGKQSIDTVKSLQAVVGLAADF